MHLVVLLLAGLALARCQSDSQSEVVTNTTEAKPERFKIQPGKGRCDGPVLDTATGLTTQTCYSPQITMAPGEIVDELYIFESPYPAGKTVGAVHHMSNIVEADTGRLVPLSEVYLHHVFADGSFVVGEGAEHAGSKFHRPLQDPYYLVIPAGRFDSPASRVVNVHVINTLGVPADKVLPCIECWCQDGHKLEQMPSKMGGGACCSSEQCISAEPNTTVRTYELQYTVIYRVLEAGMSVTQTYPFMLDAVGGFIEWDVQLPEGGAVEGDDKWTRLAATGPIDARCPQTQPLRMIKCLGHLHIGGQQMRMFNSDTKEVYCVSNTTYGRGARDELGNEDGYLVAMSMDSKDEPLVIPAGTNVTIEAIYRPENHYGVMALMFLGLVGFDHDCPGSTGAAPPGYEYWTAFGPDFANQAHSAFGFYDGQIAAGGLADATVTEDALPKQEEQAPAEDSTAGSAAHNGLLLAGAIFGAMLLGAAVVAAIVLARRRRKLDYSKLHTDTSEDAEAGSALSRP